MDNSLITEILRSPAGSFGSVVLVQRKNTPGDKLYAMKVIDKSQIRENNLLQT